MSDGDKTGTVEQFSDENQVPMRYGTAVAANRSNVSAAAWADGSRRKSALEKLQALVIKVRACLGPENLALKRPDLESHVRPVVGHQNIMVRSAFRLPLGREQLEREQVCHAGYDVNPRGVIPFEWTTVKDTSIRSPRLGSDEWRDPNVRVGKRLKVGGTDEG